MQLFVALWSVQCVVTVTVGNRTGRSAHDEDTLSLIHISEELSALGHEIIGADISESRVDSIKDKVATAFVIDATDEDVYKRQLLQCNQASQTGTANV